MDVLRFLIRFNELYFFFLKNPSSICEKENFLDFYEAFETISPDWLDCVPEKTKLLFCVDP